MNTVKTKDEINQNLIQFESYLCDGTEEEQIFASNLICAGVCFVVYKVNNEFRFAPSRYVGYADNSLSLHNGNKTKDGGVTNNAIDKVFGYNHAQNNLLEDEYLVFTSKLGITPHNKKRKYWNTINLSVTSTNESKFSYNEFPEGKLVERKHLLRERNSKLIEVAKNQFLKKEGKLFCTVCGFDFEKRYGKNGRGFIEAHHTIPISNMSSGQKTKVEDIAMVCSNCHRILHRSRPWLSITKLKHILNTKT